MSDALIEMARGEVLSINDELGIQNEKYMSLQKSLSRNSEIIGRNVVLLNKLKNATQMKHLLRMMFLIVFLVCVALAVINHEMIYGSVSKWLIKN